MMRWLDALANLVYPSEDGSAPPITNEQRLPFAVGISGLVALLTVAAL